MNICLIDADSVIPNLPLMKISAYYKQMGATVDLYKVGLPYYPTRRKTEFQVPSGYDEYYCSVVFDGNRKFILGDNIVFGGTGVDLTTVLPECIENTSPDYTIYPDNNISYGFLTRGCIRNCYFCKVPEKEGYIRQVSTVDDIVRHNKVKFLDNNILALPTHKSILKELVDKQIKCQFNQGLDIRLVDEENSLLLSSMNYLGEYCFAFDDWTYLPIIERKLDILEWRRDYQFKFFIYCHPDMDISNIVNRIEYLKDRKCLPYIMRDISCWGSEYNHFYVDIAAYCNQPNIFKSMTFYQFLQKRHKNEDRIINSFDLYNT